MSGTDNPELLKKEDNNKSASSPTSSALISPKSSQSASSFFQVPKAGLSALQETKTSTEVANGQSGAEIRLKGLQYLASYPFSELYRLFVDGELLLKYNGWEGYEKKEPGSMNANLNGLLVGVEHIMQGGALTKELILNIHKAVSTAVTGDMDKDVNPGAFRVVESDRKPVYFGIPKGRATVEGLTELFDIIETTDGEDEYGDGDYVSASFAPWKGGIIYYNVNESICSSTIQKKRTEKKVTTNAELAAYVYERMGKVEYVYTAPDESIVEGIMEEIIGEYNKSIKEAKDDDAKMKAIVRCVKYSELCHPFNDANGRTFANVLMATLLMQNGLPPATYWNPNLFDAYSTAQLVDITKAACKCTEEVIAGKGDKEIHGINTRDLPSTSNLSADECTKMNEKFLKVHAKINETLDNIRKSLTERIDTTVHMCAPAAPGGAPQGMRSAAPKGTLRSG